MRNAAFVRPLRTLIAGLLALGLAGCKDPAGPTPTSIVLSPTSVSLDAVGATTQLTAEVRDQDNQPLPDATITWSTNNSGVATVDSTGLVTAVANGTAEVTASSGSAGAGATVTVAQAVVSLVKVAGDQQVGTAGQPLPGALVVRALDRLGQPIPGQPISFTVVRGNGSVTPGTSTTNSDGQASTRWTLGPEFGGDHRVDGAHLDLQTPVSFTATAIGSYHIDVRFLSSVTAAQQQAFLDAALRWEVLIVGELINITINEPAGRCGSNSPPINETVDDLLIFATVDAIDGVGGTLGQAGPCFIRAVDSLTVVGAMIFDEADLMDLETAGLLDEVILHEMGHVIGLGTLWPLKQLVDTLPPDPHFTGPQAIDAFDRIGGATYTGNKVPIEDLGGAGTRFGHWRESVFDNELMTGFLNQGTNPLSEVTTASFGDMGYVVNLADSDPFMLTTSLMAGPTAPVLQLVDDIAHLPVYVVDPGGRVVRVIPAR